MDEEIKENSPIKENKKEEEETKEEDKKNFDDDVAICEEILRKKNYYEILGVEKSTCNEEIKKQYKKLALRLHPDKNHAPQATEAFKKVTQAFSCLTNDEKRRIYEEHGEEADFRTHYSEYFKDEEELDPQDLFDLLFTGRVNSNRRRGRPHFRQEPMTRYGKCLMFLQFIPFILMIIASTVMNFRAPSEPGFSLEMTNTYTYRRTTMNNEIPYYTEPTNDPKLQDYYDSPEFEEKIIIEYKDKLQKDCRTARNMKFDLENSKESVSSQEDLDAIEDTISNIDFSACKKLNQM